MKGGTWVGEALSRLRMVVAKANQIGNIEGLLVRHLLSEAPGFDLDWNVNCDEAWMTGDFDPAQIQCVAALGYTTAGIGGMRYTKELEEGLARAVNRDPASGGRAATIYDPTVLIGLILGARILQNKRPDFLTWCNNILAHLESSNSIRCEEPLFPYVRYLVDQCKHQVEPELSGTIFHRAFADWWYRRQLNLFPVSVDLLKQLRRTLVEDILASTLEDFGVQQAAFVWLALKRATIDVGNEALQTPNSVSRVLQQFESAMKRWRWDNLSLKQPVQWLIISEREVQDILWLILRSYFADLEDEETLPKFGHSTYRADFGIPSLGLLIEVKYARQASDFKQIEKEVLEDLVPYSQIPERYNRILVFIYDASASVQSHETTRRALISVTEITDVIIVSRPSQLPSSYSPKTKIDE